MRYAQGGLALKLRMECPLTGGVIDSDLCYDVQECIEGNLPVSLELEDFLEKGDCGKICRACEYNVLAEQVPDQDDPADADDITDEKAELAAIVQKLDQYRARFEDISAKEQAVFDQMSAEEQESEEGKKRDRLLSALYLGVNYLEDLIGVFSEHVDGVKVSDDAPEVAEQVSDLSPADAGPAGISIDSYVKWAEELKEHIEIMANSFRFCGLENPKISCYVQETEDQGTCLDIYVEVSGMNGKILKDDLVLKLNLYSREDMLVGAKEIDIIAAAFGGFDTFVFRFDNCKRLDILSYGKLYVSKC